MAPRPHVTSSYLALRNWVKLLTTLCSLVSSVLITLRSLYHRKPVGLMGNNIVTLESRSSWDWKHTLDGPERKRRTIKYVFGWSTAHRYSVSTARTSARLKQLCKEVCRFVERWRYGPRLWNSFQTTIERTFGQVGPNVAQVCLAELELSFLVRTNDDGTFSTTCMCWLEFGL